MKQSKYIGWNPWHGCRRYSEGCRYCYVYRQDRQYGVQADSALCRKTQSFALPVKRKRDGSYKIEPGSLVYTCFTSDFLLEDADAWRGACWHMIRERKDCRFLFFTKRIERFLSCVPEDWGEGYDNVMVGCTCETQEMADLRLPIFARLPIRHKSIILAPMLEGINLREHLNAAIEEVSCSGESGYRVRPLRYDWVLDVRRQCVEKNVPFRFHQTGAYFIKDGRTYHIPRKYQIEQARKAGIDFGPEPQI